MKMNLKEQTTAILYGQRKMREFLLLGKHPIACQAKIGFLTNPCDTR
jgi:hypothetical protein